MLKRLLIVVAILLGLAALADRFLARAAGEAAGAQVRRVTHTQQAADVKFRGFPFVTQAVGGTFDQVDVVARDVPVEGLQIKRIDAHFSGVHVNLGRALAGDLAAVNTDRAKATARLTYDDLNSYLRRRGSLTVAAAGGRVSISGQVRVNGAMIDGLAMATVTLRPGSIVLQVSEASAGGKPIPASAARLMTVTVPTQGLPFGIALQSVVVEADALIMRGTASGILIPPKKLSG